MTTNKKSTVKHYFSIYILQLGTRKKFAYVYMLTSTSRTYSSIILLRTVFTLVLFPPINPCSS